MGVSRSPKDLAVIGFLVAGVWVSIVPLTLVAVVAVLGACTIALVAWSSDHLKQALSSTSAKKTQSLSAQEGTSTKPLQPLEMTEQGTPAAGLAAAVGGAVQPVAAAVAATAAAATATVAAVAASATAAAADVATSAADRVLDAVKVPATPATPATAAGPAPPAPPPAPAPPPSAAPPPAPTLPAAGAVCSTTAKSGSTSAAGAQQDAVAPAAAAAPAPAVGGAAILAKLRAQKAASAAAAAAPAKAAPKPPRVVFAHASQTGTGTEIAKNLYAEALQRKMNAEVLSFNDLSVEALRPETTPILVIVAASTGDGDPPDNAATTYLALRRQQGSEYLRGLRFTVLGLGDSNYTRFMAVSRSIKSKLQELGAELFYPAAEADEVDGLETKIDPWTEGLWGPLTQALAAAADGTGIGTGATGAAGAGPAAGGAPITPTPNGAAPVASNTTVDAAAAASPGTGTGGLEEDHGLVQGRAPPGVDLKGAPAPAPCRVRVEWEKDPDAVAAVLSRESGRPHADDLQYRDPQGQYSHDKPFWSTITDARIESAPWSERRVLHLRMDLSGSGIEYEAGDSLGVSPANPPDLVQGLAEHLGLQAGEVFRVVSADEVPGDKAVLPHLPSPCSVHYAFTYCLDVTGAPKKSLLRTLADHCSDEADKRTLTFFTAKAGREAYAHYIVANQPSLLDLLRSFPSCRPPLAVLLDALPPIVPRLYSVTTSGTVYPNSAEVALSVVRFPTRYGTRQGVATNWLDKLTLSLTTAQQQQQQGGVGGDANGGSGTDGMAGSTPPLTVPVHFKRAADFKPPKDLSKPLIMIGPGTGVAPFRGFLQYRRAALQAAFPNGRVPDSEGVGAAWLYFGCRREDEDFLYQSDLRGFESDGTLQRLRLAFSREGAEKVYVQHRMREDAQDLAPLIEAGAYVYVCGDGANMVKDVHAALLYVLVSGGGLSEDAAAAKLAEMVKDRRYVRDVWS